MFTDGFLFSIYQNSMVSIWAVLKPLLGIVGGAVCFYVAFISLLTIPYFQDHVIYLHGVTLTWFQDVNIPEQWGFLRNQVTPFRLNTPDGEALHAWHVLPLDVYRKHQEKLRSETVGLSQDITKTLGFKLLQQDPTARLVLYFHGAAGTLASGWRPQSYRAISAAAQHVHVIAIDYRGFGTSTGWPSESGLLTDALTLATFATETAGIPPERIVLFAQSLGTAVSLSLAQNLSRHSPPVFFSGIVLVAPFANVELLTKTYKVAGTVPLLSPVAIIPMALAFLNRFIKTKWPSKDKISSLVRHLDSLKNTNHRAKYDITLIHAEDDYDIPWLHSDILFLHAVNAMRTVESPITFNELEKQKERRKTPLGDGGWEVEWKGNAGTVREQIVKYGLHDRVMSYPIVSLAVSKAFNADEAVEK
jgi:abhydrolase domain-containing protein 12